MLRRRRSGIILGLITPTLSWIDGADMSDLRRAEFGNFLRSRRTKLTPKAVGLPDGRRRRTTGLRREEVAELAGIGVD
jgi:hypothetical protein